MSVGVTVFLILPNNLPTASFLGEEERAVAVQRLRGIEHGTGNKEMYVTRLARTIPVSATNWRHLKREEEISWSEVRRGLTSLQTWLSASAYFGLLTGIYSFGLFVSFPLLSLGLRSLTCLASNDPRRYGIYSECCTTVVCNPL